MPRDRFKPEGYPTLSPYLISADAARVVDFMRAAFDAVPLRRFDNDDGTIIHAEFRIDDGVVMIGDAGENWPAVPTHLHLYVADVDTTFRRAIAAGATPVQAPGQREGDPDRRGGVRDMAGNTWWIATQVT